MWGRVDKRWEEVRLKMGSRTGHTRRSYFRGHVTEDLPVSVTLWPLCLPTSFFLLSRKQGTKGVRPKKYVPSSREESLTGGLHLRSIITPDPVTPLHPDPTQEDQLYQYLLERFLLPKFVQTYDTSYSVRPFISTPSFREVRLPCRILTTISVLGSG